MSNLMAHTRQLPPSLDGCALGRLAGRLATRAHLIVARRCSSSGSAHTMIPKKNDLFVSGRSRVGCVVTCHLGCRIWRCSCKCSCLWFKKCTVLRHYPLAKGPPAAHQREPLSFLGGFSFMTRILLAGRT